MGPFFLFPGIEVGPWRVVEPVGGGVHGAVYRVERMGHEHAGPFALKMARAPQDPRFEREGHLLSIVRHPHVPQLRDRGEWTVPGGPSFPYLVMEFIDGMPLYAWAETQLRSRAQLLRLLAHAARALEATHSAGGLHRDVKGGNILVRSQTPEAVLVDFGTGYYPGASILTRQLPPPGTPQYRSPESLRFQWEHLHRPRVRYAGEPADDVYALGMTAYRLLTGSYPPPQIQVETIPKGARLVHQPLVLPERWSEAEPSLTAILLQLLSAEPSARGTAGEVAQMLEHEAARALREVRQLRHSPAAPRTGVPSSLPAASPARHLEASTRPESSPPPLRPRRRRALWLAATTAVAVLSTALWWSQQTSRAPLLTAGTRGSAGTGTAELADSAVPLSAQEASPAPTRRGFALELPKKPLPGQSRAPCVKPEVEINGGCWSGPTEEAPPCGARSYPWKNGCYRPILEPPQPATSDPH
jgi:serine/threonine protein kinase